MVDRKPKFWFPTRRDNCLLHLTDRISNITEELSSRMDWFYLIPVSLVEERMIELDAWKAYPQTKLGILRWASIYM